MTRRIKTVFAAAFSVALLTTGCQHTRATDGVPPTLRPAGLNRLSATPRRLSFLNTSVTFATQEQAQNLLGTSDVFTRS